MRAKVPASSANLGPGFDVLAVALNAYIEVEVSPADSFHIETSGYGAGQFDGENHLAAQIVRETAGHSNFSLVVHSDIPLSRGLGSSAALAIAAALAAEALDPLFIATNVDGHAENAAASLVGGLVAVQVVKERPIVRSLPIDQSWRFVAAIPEMEMSTDLAREALPATIPFGDAVSNLAALALLIPGLAERSLFVASALDDFLHQPYRERLLPFSRGLRSVMREAGAAGTCWSGSGSTMLALVGEEESIQVARAVQTFFHDEGLAGEARTLEVDHIGAVVS